ncbi:MAG: DNA repair protein RadC [Treponema sp.]|jgi:DNA repair protein RadC|nr:DNA repair protein RadC [Treponema sp.]
MNVRYPDCFAESQVRYPGGKNIPRDLRDLPPDQRPRERLLSKGPTVLSDTELLMIILNTGIQGKNVTELAKELMELLDNHTDIPPVEEFSRLSGMGEAKASVVAAMLEFGRRRWGYSGTLIRHPSEIFAIVRHYASRKQECFISISLNGAHEALAVRVVTIGLVNRTIVHPREVFADIIQDRAAAFVVAHNHPSGRLQPSPEDDEITFRLHSAAEILGLHFLDHLIFSENSWWSYRQNGKLPETKQAE